MSFWTAIVVIFAIWGLVQIIRTRRDERAGRHYDTEADSAVRDDAELKREIARLQERLEVLERITTDAHSSEARERRRLSAEIDNLRGRE